MTAPRPPDPLLLTALHGIARALASAGSTRSGLKPEDCLTMSAHVHDVAEALAAGPDPQGPGPAHAQVRAAACTDPGYTPPRFPPDFTSIYAPPQRRRA